MAARGAGVAMPAELRWALGALGLFVLSMIVPGGRVLVVPTLFLLVLILLYWAAKPGREE